MNSTIQFPQNAAELILRLNQTDLHKDNDLYFRQNTPKREVNYSQILAQYIIDFDINLDFLKVSEDFIAGKTDINSIARFLAPKQDFWFADDSDEISEISKDINEVKKTFSKKLLKTQLSQIIEKIKAFHAKFEYNSATDEPRITETLSKDTRTYLKLKICLILPTLYQLSAQENKLYTRYLNKIHSLNKTIIKENYLTGLASFSLQGFTIKNMILEFVNFTGCDLQDITFMDCTFENCIFEATTLAKTQFINCTLENCSFNEAELKQTIIEQTKIINCEVLTGTTYGIIPINADIDKKFYENVADDNQFQLDWLDKKDPVLAKLVKKIIAPLDEYINKRCSRGYNNANKKRSCKMLFAQTCRAEIIGVGLAYADMDLEFSEKRTIEEAALKRLEGIRQKHTPLFTASLAKSRFKTAFESFDSLFKRAKKENEFRNEINKRNRQINLSSSRSGMADNLPFIGLQLSKPFELNNSVEQNSASNSNKTHFFAPPPLPSREHKPKLSNSIEQSLAPNNSKAKLAPPPLPSREYKPKLNNTIDKKLATENNNLPKPML